jgi:beta-phosphoglucomutase-like phosphatase (HAD superfamily)
MSTKPLMRGVIVDLAGTVVDFGARATMQAMRESFAIAYNVILPEPLLRASMGRPAREHLRDICLSIRNHSADETVGEAFFGEEKRRFMRLGDAVRFEDCPSLSELGQSGGRRARRATASFHNQGQPRCANDVADELYLTLRERMPDWVAHRNQWTSRAVPHVLKELREAGVRVAFCTEYDRNAAAPFVRLLEASFGSDHGMPVLTADDVERGSPSPEMSLRAAEILGLEPPTCLRVGDTVMDMAEGSAAGMRPVGVLDCGNEVGLPRNEFQCLDQLERDRMRSWASHTLTRAGATATISSLAALKWFL